MSTVDVETLKARADELIAKAIAGEAKRRADQTLETMPNKQRTAFLLRNHQGLSIADIAKVMKTTEGTVRVYLHRAVAALRQSLVELV